MTICAPMHMYNHPSSIFLGSPFKLQAYLYHFYQFMMSLTEVNGRVTVN